MAEAGAAPVLQHRCKVPRLHNGHAEPTERDPLLGSNRSHDSSTHTGKLNDLNDLDIESGGRVHGGDGSVDMNRRAASSTDGAALG